MKKCSLTVGHFEIILFIWMYVKKPTYLFINIIQVPMITGFPIFFYNIIVNENIFSGI